MPTKRIDQLTAAVEPPASTDIIEIERNPDGARTSEKLTIAQLAASEAFSGGGGGDTLLSEYEDELATVTVTAGEELPANANIRALRDDSDSKIGVGGGVLLQSDKPVTIESTVALEDIGVNIWADSHIQIESDNGWISLATADEEDVKVNGIGVGAALTDLNPILEAVRNEDRPSAGTLSQLLAALEGLGLITDTS